MKGIAFLLLCFVLAACSSGGPGASPSDEILLRLGPVFLTRSELETRIAELGSEYVPYLRTQAGKKTMLEAVLRQKLMVRAALERGLDQDGAVREEARRMRYEQRQAFRLYQESLMLDSLMGRLRSNELKVSDEEIADYYKEHQKLYHVRHILLAERKKADEIMEQIKKSKGNLEQEFIQAAKNSSLESFSAKEGGRMPPFLQGELDAEFERAAQGLSPGQISAPVETPVGVHLIYMEGASLALFADEIRDRCRRILEKKKLEALMEVWKNKYLTEVRDDSLRPYL